MKFDLYKDGSTIIYYNKPKKDLLLKANHFLIKKDRPENADLIKYQEGSTRNRIIYRAKVDDEIYYFKKFVNHSFGKIIKDFFRTQRATRTMFLRKKMYQHDIACYDIRLAMILTKKLFNRPSLIVTKQYTGKSIFDILSNDVSQAEKYKILEKLIDFYVKMLKTGFYHGDPNLKNFIFENNKIKLIDLDDIRYHKKIPNFLLKRNLKKFNRILLLANIRPRYSDLDFNSYDREYLIKEIVRKFDKNLNQNKMWRWLERKSKVRIDEVTKFVNSYENIRKKRSNENRKILV